MYENEYNRGIRVKLSQINKKAIDHENRINNNSNDEHKLTTRLEGMCMRNKNIHGGSGYAVATLDDRGYKEDSTLGAGVSAAGMSAAGVSAAGISGAGVRPIGSGRKKKDRDWNSGYHRRCNTCRSSVSSSAFGRWQEAKGKKTNNRR